MAERTLFPQPHPLGHLVSHSFFDIRNCSTWIYRYERKNENYWRGQADKCRTLFLQGGERTVDLFLTLPPNEKRKIIELVSFFGKEEDAHLASHLITRSLQLYSDPAGGTPYNEQKDFFNQSIITSPDILLRSLDTFFHDLRTDPQTEDSFGILYTIRSTQNPKTDPHMEREFLKRQIHELNLARNEKWIQHYQAYQDIYTFFGLRYDEAKGQLQ